MSRDDAAPPAEQSGAHAKVRWFNERRTYLAALAVLLVVLVVLIVMLLRLDQPVDITQRGGETRAGIEPVFAIYGPGSGKKPLFSGPMATAWGPDDRIYVADSKNNRIVVFDSAGRYLLQFGGFGIAKPSAGSKATWKRGQLNYPTGVAVDTNGDIYVADFNNDSISVFNAKGAFQRRFPDPNSPTGRGGSGTGNNGIAVTAVAVSGGKVYATDAYQVFVFDTQGNLLKQFGRPGSEPGGLDHPNGIAVDEQGRIYVTDSNHSRVTAFSPEGAVVWSTGTPIESLTAASPSPFVLPRGITILANHSLLVADPLTHQLVKLNPAGAFVVAYGDRGEAPGQLNFPNGVAAREGLILVADKENNRVQAVRLVGP